jgi:hypothetical protein
MISLKILLITTATVLSLNLILRLVRIKIKPTKTLLFIALALIFIGATLSVSQERAVQYYTSMKNWPETSAEVTETKITGKFAILPEINYQYTVNDSSYLGKTNLDIPGFGNRKKRNQTARIILNDYKPGEKITVIYEPQNPSNSRIRVNPPWNIYGRMGFGVFLFACGCFLILCILFQKSNH